MTAGQFCMALSLLAVATYAGILGAQSDKVEERIEFGVAAVACLVLVYLIVRYT